LTARGDGVVHSRDKRTRSGDENFATVITEHTEKRNAITSVSSVVIFRGTTRAGLHCAPQAHRTAGTLECGALCFSPGYFNTADDVDYAVESLQNTL
jgi:selenocysteine lyase/cysteine desulfurase